MDDVPSQYWKSVPGWCAFEEVYRKAVMAAKEDRKYIFVEIGCWQGKSACLMAHLIRYHGRDVDFYCIDPWDDGGPDLWATEYYQRLKKPLRECFDMFTAPYADIIKPVQNFSANVADMFADKSIDFIMIDGAHNYEAVRKDIDLYLPKMRPGSVMAGDDYLWPGVKKAADETFGKRLNAVIKGRNADYLMSVAHWWVQL